MYETLKKAQKVWSIIVEYGKIVLEVFHIIIQDSWRDHNFHKHSCFEALMMIEYPVLDFLIVWENATLKLQEFLKQKVLEKVRQGSHVLAIILFGSDNSTASAFYDQLNKRNLREEKNCSLLSFSSLRRTVT